jgi:hypothetical protein
MYEQGAFSISHGHQIEGGGRRGESPGIKLHPRY